jgi:hypothetical protein
MVPRRGLEPPRPCERQHLKLVRLPIPPSGHGVGARLYWRVGVLSTLRATACRGAQGGAWEAWSIRRGTG